MPKAPSINLGAFVQGPGPRDLFWSKHRLSLIKEDFKRFKESYLDIQDTE